MTKAGAGTVALVAVTALGVAAGAALALRGFGGDPPGRTLALRAVLESERAVRVEGFEPTDAAWVEVALRERGLAVTDDVGAPRLARLDASSELAASLLRRVTERDDGIYVRRSGPPLESLPWIHSGLDPEAPDRPASFIVAPEGASPQQLDRCLHAVLRASRSFEPGSASVDGAVVSLDGFGKERPEALLGALAEDAARLAASLGVSGEPDPVGAGIAWTLDERSRLVGSVDDAGWHSPYARGLTVAVADRPAADEALREYAKWLLLDELGAPADLWFAEGVAAAAVRSIRGDDAAPRPVLDVTFEEAIGIEPRTRAARLDAAATLATLAAPDAASRRAIWEGGLDADALEALRAEWDRWRVDNPALPDERPRRRLPRTAAVRLTAERFGPGSYGSREAHAALQRIADLGFGAVALTVHVPVGPAEGDAARRSVAFGGWGRHVTTDGDGAVLATARAARDLGLEVVLWPRFVAGPDGPLVTQQPHPSPKAIERLGRRYALAVEGVAHLAERAGAAGLVLIPPRLMPRPPSDPPETLAAQASFRRQAIAFARPFRGAVLAIGRSRPRLELATQATEMHDVVLGFELGSMGPDVKRPWNAYEKRLRSMSGASGGRVRVVEAQFDGRDGTRRDELLLAAAQALGAVSEVDFFVLSHWRVTARAGDPTRYDLRAVPDDVLRAVASARR